MPEFDGGKGRNATSRYLETGEPGGLRSLSSTQEVGAGGVTGPAAPWDIWERTGGPRERIEELHLLSGVVRVASSDYDA